MAAEKYSDKMLTDAKAAASNAVSFGMETGQVPIDDAHTVNNAAFNTGALYQQDGIVDPRKG